MIEAMSTEATSHLKIKLKKKFEDHVNWSQLTDFKKLVSCCADWNTCSFQQTFSFQYNHLHNVQEIGWIL